MQEAVIKFFTERKEDRLKKELKLSMNDEEVQAVHEEVTERFDLENWLPNAAKRAGQISLSSHPCTFSHPSSARNKNGKTMPVIARIKSRIDGYVRTGNVVTELDASGNAAALDVYKFITLQMDDDQLLIDHLEKNTDLAKQLFNIQSSSYEDLREGFLAIKNSESEPITSSKIKQVYFPVEDNYHLLSILTPSGLIYELRNRIQSMRFSDEVKLAREKRKNNEESETGFDDIFNLSMIGFGGTKPQNISVLNNKYGGKAYLLPSVPPALEPKKRFLPKTDFFQTSLWPYQFKESFEELHKLLLINVNNENIRRGRDNIWLYIFDRILETIWRFRNLENGWSIKEDFASLPKYQKVMLDNYWLNEREADSRWSDEFTKEIARWIISAYRTVKDPDKGGLFLADDEIKYLRQLISQQREVL